MGRVLDYQQHVTRDPEICDGELVMRGTRVPLRTVLASLAEGASVEEIVADFPSVSAEQVRAVIALAAAFTEDSLSIPGLPGATCG
jgi:uncharacterized protein (DUF433 family)